MNDYELDDSVHYSELRRCDNFDKVNHTVAPSGDRHLYTDAKDA